jgi:hypothetical protein
VFWRPFDQQLQCTPAERVWIPGEQQQKCHRCTDLDYVCGPPQHSLRAPVPRAESHRLYQENQTSVHDDQHGGLSERGEGFTIQVQEKPSSLSLSLGKKSSSFADNIGSGSGFGDSVDFSRATRTFGLTAGKTWDSSQISPTISKDNTEGECARQAKLLADFGQKLKLCTFQHNFTSSKASVEATTAPMSDKTNLRKVRSGQGMWSILKEEFEKNPYPDPQEIYQLAQEVGLNPGTINVSSNKALLEPFLLTTKYSFGYKIVVQWRT